MARDGQERIWVDIDLFREATGEQFEATAAALGVKDQIEDAGNLAVDLTIRTSALLKYPGVYKQIREHLRFAADGMSVTEAARFQETLERSPEARRKAMEEAARALETVKREGGEALRVKENLRATFMSLGVPWMGEREAEAWSTVYTAGLANEARILNESLKKRGLKEKTLQEYVDSWFLKFRYSEEGHAAQLILQEMNYSGSSQAAATAKVREDIPLGLREFWFDILVPPPETDLVNALYVRGYLSNVNRLSDFRILSQDKSAFICKSRMSYEG
jgi:hypothetical protein